MSIYPNPEFERIKPGSELLDDEWSTIYAEVAEQEESDRNIHLRNILAVIETLEEIGYFTYPEGLSGEQMADEVLESLESNARDDERFNRARLNRGRP